MDEREKEKAELGAQTLQNFCKQFGGDIHAQILLEELFEGLLNEEALFVFGKQNQTGDQIGHSPSERIDNNIEVDKSGVTGPSADLATQDRPDYP